MAGGLWGFFIFKESCAKSCAIHFESRKTPCQEIVPWGIFGYVEKKRDRIWRTIHIWRCLIDVFYIRFLPADLTACDITAVHACATEPGRPNGLPTFAIVTDSDNHPFRVYAPHPANRPTCQHLQSWQIREIAPFAHIPPSPANRSGQLPRPWLCDTVSVANQPVRAEGLGRNAGNDSGCRTP